MKRVAWLLIFTGLPGWCVNLIHSGVITRYGETCADIQSAWRAATGGDVVELSAGRLYACGTATLRLPRHSGAGAVLVRTSNFRNLPDGHTRICPPGSTAAAGAISYPCTPNIASSGGAAGSSGGDLAILQWDANFTCGIASEAGASDWHFLGLELRGTSNNPPVSWSTVLSLNMGVLQNATSVNDRAQRIVVDRCWLHGYFGQNGPTRGIWADGSAIQIVNNVIEEIKQYSQDAQCITQLSGPGPIVVRNNFLAGGGENSMSGGSPTIWKGSVPGFYRFAGNYSTRDQRWWIVQKTSAPPAQSCTSGRWWQNTSGGACYQCQSGAWVATPCSSMPSPNVYQVLKNLYEHKVMKGAVIEGNLFDAYWDNSGQHAAVLLFNAASTQNLYQFSERDIEFQYNVVSRSASGLALANPNASLQIVLPLDRIRIQHNLFDNVVNDERYNGWPSESAYNNGIQFASGGAVFRHNSIVNSSNLHNGSMIYGATRSRGQDSLCPRCSVLDSVMSWGWSITSPFVGDSYPAADVYFSGSTTNLHAWDYGVARGNIFALDRAAPYSTYRTKATSGVCCAGNTIVTVMGDALDANYRVKAPYAGAATDGADPGADLDTVRALTAHAADGAANPYLDFQVNPAVCQLTSCTLYIRAPDAAAAPGIRVSTSESMTAPVAGVALARSGAAITASLTGLAPGTRYWYTVSFPAAGGGSVTRKGELRTRVR